MMFSDRKQQLLLQRLAGAGLLQSEQSVANDRPRREERDGPAVLSNAQRRMWYHSQLAEGSAAYNFCLVLRPDENSSLSVPALTAALEQVVLRHEILRTRYRAGADGAPQQVIEPYLAPDVTEIDVTPASNEFAETIEERLDDLACRARDQPFDLKVDAPLRTLVVRSGAAVIAIILVLPHIAGDGGSFGIVLADLERAYGHGAGSDASPPASSIRYSDYALWEQRHLGDPKTPASLHARQLRFWETQLADLPAEIPLPFDRPRPTTPSFSGSQVREWLGEGLSAALRRIAGTYGGTPLVALQCAVAVALGRVGAGQDIPLGAAVDLRHDSSLDQLVGFFSNTVVVRVDRGRDSEFSELFQRVHDTGLKALDNSDAPFESVVEHINPPRAVARNPLFGVMVTATRPWPVLRFGDTTLRLEEPRQTQAKFDLTFVVHDEGAGGRIGVSLLYARDLFDETTARHLLDLVIGILGQAAHHPQLRLSQFAEFGQRCLTPRASSLATILAARQGASSTTMRSIQLADGVRQADVVAALVGLLGRHDALRLRRDAENGRWDLAATARLWDAPVLLEQPATAGDAERFVAWLEVLPGSDSATPKRFLKLQAPGRWIDDESWNVLLAELSPLRSNGRPTAPNRAGSYADWLTRTADFAAETDMVAHTESWLDMLDEAADRAPTGEFSENPFISTERRMALPGLGERPDPAALRVAAMAALIWTKRRAAAPLLLEIDEADRDRFANTTTGTAAGWCRRRFPFLVAAPQEGAAESQLSPQRIDSFIRAARHVPGLDNPEPVSGDFAASYFLARDVSADVAGALDDTPRPDLTLAIITTDEGDAPISPEADIHEEGERWTIRIDPRRKQAWLGIRARRSASEIDALIDAWRGVLAEFLAAAAPADGGARSEDDGILELSPWDLRRIEESFGTVRTVLPLSPLQEGLRFHAVGAAEGSNEVYISQTSLDLLGEIDADRLHRAVETAIKLTPTVTAGFAEIGGRMVQVVPADVKVPWRFERAADEDRARLIADQEYAAQFDAARPPLIRFALIGMPDADAGGLNRLLLTAHHILLDGWSIRLLYRLIVQLYLDPAGTAPPPSFGRYLRWFTGQNMADAETVWNQVLAGSEATILYPAARGLEASVEHSHERARSIDAGTTTALSRLARSASTTLSTVLELAWGTLLMRLSGASNVVFGNVVSGRPADIEQVSEIIGLLFNTVPVRVEAAGPQSVKAALGALHAQKAVSLRHSHVNLTRLQQIAGHSPLFDTLFSVQNLPVFESPRNQAIRIGHASVRDATHYPLSMSVTPTGETIDLRLMFRSDIVGGEQAEAIIHAYEHILNAFARDADLPLLAVNALPETSLLLPRSISGENMEIGSLSVADLLVKQALATPDDNAVTSGDARLTFDQLASAAHRLAHLLQARGVWPEHRVALLLPRSELMIVALFGVFAAHAAYVPIDPETPVSRVRSMLDQSQPTVILSVSEMTALLPPEYANDPRVVLLDDPATKAELERLPNTLPESERPAGLRHLAYIIFTSGSTGEPKGVAVPYIGLTSMFINHRMAIFAPVLAAQGGRRLKIAHTTSFAFDASWEQLLWLLAGHEVYVIDDELRRDPDRLLPLFDREEIDAFDVTPTYGGYLLEHGLLERDRPQGRDGTGVVFVSLGGEAVGQDLWTRLREAPGVGGYNLYGPTEYTINALGADLAENSEPTVGRPIANTDAHILDPGLHPAPVGVTGELYLGGAGLARGYVGRPAMTADRFVANPFGNAGERIYRTGDLCRWRPDGGIDYLGRSDNQLKIRGYRIEPAEVENALVAQTGVKRAAVVGNPTPDGSVRLIAYVVSDAQVADADSLRERLRLQLPSYMVPAVIVFVEDLPRTINGKLDIASLPNPATAEVRTALPINETERIICDLFASVLDRRPIGRFDDFFESGGHSLLTVRLVGLLRDAIGPGINVRQIYDHPTPAALALSLGTTHGIAPVQAGSADADRETALMLADLVLPPDIAVPDHGGITPRPALATINSVLLTGAAGFIGSFILAELLRNSEARIHCLVRARDEAGATARIRQSLTLHGLWDDVFEHRIVGLPGDLSQPRLGLTEETFAALADDLDVIIHNGGATNEFDPYSRLAAINVGGAKEILRLAAGGSRVTPVHFVSTASVVARRGANPPVIGESTRLPIGEVESTGYVQSKWVAEELMHAAAARGLSVTIHRPGRVSGHSVTGACSTSVGFWHFIRSMLVLGAAPALRSDRLTLAPVDYVAKALVALVERGDPGATYHLSNRMQTSIGAIVEAAQRAGHHLEIMPFEAWRERLAQAAEERTRRDDDSLSSILLLVEHLDKYDGPAVESALGQEAVQAALAGLDIAPPPITDAVLDRYVEHFIATGFFPAADDGRARSALA
ncbi:MULTISPECIES: non-ribosomal peptide synthetase [unclassified Rhizobium]|uniref:non-ribosomal peptide synthetase n=1 Tax=unclassified Rhizobium TaxID=2613769 RepID=UPI001ADA7A4B|nr:MULTISPECIES: non-ribosomal peptide synthetase [unclassified Rhizobium]MBO9101941.1 amino acid adenylation domain-containing protein [Rhizobium sp. L58/93]MBO9172112.1 amino acid adenylation domain-containing protein [Rhizobium sp. L245/93]QXZ88327.1 amino acid adenylation domain-containing protein [Rhizobium sp. K1/93]QXZ94298.1 amino acid adenylation domain-containing protein [Rhizobium sp. K15/93]QYA05613.1 amino acid adenylation domain-containing protein [Rhizobium sp. B21/90]